MANRPQSSNLVRACAAQLRAQLAQCLAPGDEELASRKVTAAMDECLGSLSQSNIWGVENQVPSSELWNIAGSLLETGWLQARARLKPRGYAGDHDLLARIAERQICEHPLGRYFDRYFQAQAAPQAVRNRMQIAAKWIEEAVRGGEDICRVAVFGSGPAIEIACACQHLAPEALSRLRVVLLDMDDQALESASTRLAPLLSAEQLTVVQGNLFRLAQRPPLAAHLEGADLILCTGLFDYLNDPAAAAMLGEFWRRLAPEGAAYVFNFAPHNPTRAYMEWIGNWYLNYRNEGELANLARAAGIPQRQWNPGAESLGIDLFLRIAKS